MKLTLKQWQEIDEARETAAKALDKLASLFLEHAIRIGVNDPDAVKLLELHNQVRDASMLPQTHPQSEWLGGSSDEPNNHTLREPYCVGYLQRYFTRAEIAEAKLECLGPCQWRKTDPAAPGIHPVLK